MDMDMERKQFLMDKLDLKNIKEKINNIEGVSIRNAYKKSDICERYLCELDKICAIGFPILTTKERGDKKYKYIEYLYQYLNLQASCYNWLVPNFNESSWWVELEIKNICNFINSYYPGYIQVQIIAIDTKNQLLFDIEDGESDFEYRIIWL